MGQYGRFRDLLLPIFVLAVVVVMVLPMPTWLIDIALAMSITISILILMTVMFIEKPLELSAFPTILLLSTALRLALNIASTRLILTYGHTGTDAAGHVIEAFGGFVMGGNFVIGIIVFTILIIINFMVITKGSGRIAEVAARFSLDAMPGKQMAIDADLSSGLIDENEARLRRKELEQESGFYGAMDGAAKFVRGDAVASILIAVINIVGGISIGVVQNDLALKEAAHNYTNLTVGDGLVSQIPALIVSIAAGLMVAKAGTTGAMDQAVSRQLSQYPKALGLASGTLLVMAILPGIPFIPFALMAAMTGGAAYYTPRIRARENAERVAQEVTAAQKPAPAEAPISSTLAMDMLRLELGYGLLNLATQGESGNRLTDQIKGLRRQLAQEFGFVLPSVRIQDDLQLAPNAYRLRVKEIVAGTGDLRPNMLLCMDPKGQAISLPGERTKEPTFGLPAMWIDKRYREEAHFKAYTVVDPQTVITTHLTEIVKDHMSELLSYTEVQKLLDEMDKSAQKLVADTIPGLISLMGVQRILQNLLGERVSIRDLPTILEGIAEASAQTKNLTMITEHVRMRLARQICDQQTGPSGLLPMVPLSPEWEQAFLESLVGGGEEKQLAMPPSQLQQFIARLTQVFEEQAKAGEAPVLLTSPTIRPYVRSIIERLRPSLVVMSQSEIHPKARIKTVGQI
ncbi:MAG TPA: flagellar biosynthesis protein FlhA [Alphaproteobacteria bacterium]